MTSRSKKIAATLAGLVLAALAIIGLFSKLSLHPAVESAAAASGQPAQRPDFSARIAAANSSDFSRLLDRILGEDGAGRDPQLAALLSAWIARDPANFRAFLNSLGLDENEALSEKFFAALPGALPNVDDKTASSPYLAELVVSLIEENAENDPHAAAKWAEQWLLGDSLDHARAIIVGELAKDSPQEALQLFEKIQQPLRHIQALDAIGSGYAENDPAAAAKWAQSLPHDTEIAVAMNSVLAVVAKSDPDKASAAFDALQSRISTNYARAVAADRRARGLPEKPPVDARGNPVVEDEGGETVYSTESPDIGLLADAAETIINAQAKSDPEGALHWADGLQGVLQAKGRRTAYGAWAENEPEAALAAYYKSGWVDPETVRNIFSSWTDSSPEAAAAEAVRVSEPVQRGEAISSGVETWAQSIDDSSAMTQWIDRLSKPSDRDTANRVFVETLDGDQPAVAWARALMISNADQRKLVLKSAFSSFVMKDPAAASAELAQARTLTPGERDSLTKLLPARAAAR